MNNEIKEQTYKKYNFGLQSLLIIIGLIITINQIYITIISDIPLNVFPFITILMGYIFIIYYSAISYKKEGKSYIISIILYMITLILSIIPIMVFINFIAGLVQLIQLILLIYFVKNRDNTKVASKAIVLFTVLSIVVSIIIYLNGYGIRSMDGIPSMFLSGTYALIYYMDKKLPPFNKS